MLKKATLAIGYASAFYAVAFALLLALSVGLTALLNSPILY